MALSPEGTRSKSGQLMRFKKGPFYVQAGAGDATVTPLVILGNYELWPPNYYFTCPGKVVMRYLPPIDPKALPEGVRGSKEELSRYGALAGRRAALGCALRFVRPWHRIRLMVTPTRADTPINTHPTANTITTVRRQMFEAIHDITSNPSKYGTPGGPLSWPLRLLNLASIGCFWLGAAALWGAVTAASDAQGFSRAALGGGFLAYSLSVTAGLYVGYAKMVR